MKMKIALTSVAYIIVSATAIQAAATGSSVSNNELRARVGVVAVLTAGTATKTALVRTVAASRMSSRELAHQARTRMLAQYRSLRTRLTSEQLSAILFAAGFKGNGHRKAWAIVMRESMGRPLAHNQNASTGDNSYGLFQVNMIGALGTARRIAFGLRANTQLFDPLTNAGVAYKMSNGGRNFGAWGVGPGAYRSGHGESTISGWYTKYPGVITAYVSRAGKHAQKTHVIIPDLR